MKTGSWAASIIFGLGVLMTSAQAQTYPTFEVDPNWPKQMPHGYFFGQVAGITVDSKDNVWVISRPRRVVPQLDEPPQEASGVPAPSVVAFDPERQIPARLGRAVPDERCRARQSSNGRCPSMALRSMPKTMSGFAAMAATPRRTRTTITA
jgi:hypothetical protein